MAVAASVMPLGPILREATFEADRRLKDKTYQRSPIGKHVARYLSALKWADAPDNTIDSYETTYARLCNDHDDFEDGLKGFETPVGTEYLREFLDRHWADAAPNTKAQRLAAIKSLFAWAVDEGICSYSPAAKIQSPRNRNSVERVAYSQDVLYQLIRYQPRLRDQCAIQLMGRMGLRKNEVRVLRVGEIDLIRDLITVHGKGNKVVVLPLAIKSVRDLLSFHITTENRQPDEYLLYPHNKRKQPMESSSMHRWFGKCLERAGFPKTMMMHELRHTAADHLYRKTGNIVQAQKLLRHAHSSTTEGYLHPTRRDLAEALATLDDDWGVN